MFVVEYEESVWVFCGVFDTAAAAHLAVDDRLKSEFEKAWWTRTVAVPKGAWEHWLRREAYLYRVREVVLNALEP